MDGVHKLMPYTMIKQTLRIGNAATMLGGMMRLLLAKVTVGAISNWFGFTQNADDGMNLLQRIISMVLSWDASVFRRLAEKIEKARDGPSKDHIKVIKRYVTEATRDQHEHIRAMSREKPESIIAAIFSDSQPDLLSSLSDAQHAQCLEYLSAILSVRDREEITNVLCRRNPDLFTQAIRDLIAAFEPIIRTLHENVDLREHVSAAEKVLNDFIETSKSKRVEGNELMGEHPPSVEDYVRLLERNRQFLYKWVHQVAANCPEVREVVRTWAKKTVRVFRQRHSDAEGPRGSTEENIASRNDPRPHETPARQKPSSGQAGDMTSVLQQLFQNLPDGNQTDLLRDLDAHAKYLAALNTLSLERMQRVLNNLKHEAGSTMTSNGNDRIGKANAASSGQAGILRRPWPFSTAASGSLSGRGTPASMSSATAPSKQSTSGPGVFLLRWQALLDRTLITPATANGPLRSGKDVKASTTPAKAAAIAASGDSRGSDWDSGSFARRAEEDVPTAPNVSAILRALGPGFRHLIMDIAREDALFSAG
ncbi:hypothetical protein VTK73DRAFT_444 [Phialemonium thermophilum]|uniref:PX domain-containing protein n=1 Tax=Phialemonium thermophilum TaxID=223376 RepID=A0ABR3XF36_9PEZI